MSRTGRSLRPGSVLKGQFEKLFDTAIGTKFTAAITSAAALIEEKFPGMGERLASAISVFSNFSALTPVQVATTNAYTQVLPDGKYVIGFNQNAQRIPDATWSISEQAHLSDKSENSAWRGTAIHELAHVVAREAGFSWGAATDDPRMELALSKYRGLDERYRSSTMGQMMDGVSRYAAYSPAEFFAETFADFVLNGNNAKSASKVMMEVMAADVNRFLRG